MIRLAIGWTLVHSLWEGAAVALLLALALFVLRSSRSRYAAACIALLTIVLGFALTLSYSLQAGRAPATAVLRREPAISLDNVTLRPASTPRFNPASFLPWLTPFWIMGVVIFQLYHVASWMAARRMLRRGVCNPPDVWNHRLAQLRARLQISAPVTMLESCVAEVPAVMGWLRPVILVPAGLLAGMSATQIEAILIHELAHIRRGDYLINVIQNVVESFLFYHPAVWWISRVIRVEREHCCDDIVVAANGDAPAYAAALAALERTRWEAHDAALAATGGNLMKRIRRLLYPAEGPSTALSPVLSATILTLTTALVVAAWQTNNAAPVPKSPYLAWVQQDVAYIITNEERARFKALETDDERKMFIQQFWERRNPTPGSSNNRAKEEHYRRIAYANAHFPSSLPGWKTDRGRIYIIYGPPDEIETHPGGGPAHTYPYEQWLYHHVENIGDNVMVEFIDPENKGEFRENPWVRLGPGVPLLKEK
jgi:GWxTD domain-containing protein